MSDSTKTTNNNKTKTNGDNNGMTTTTTATTDSTSTSSFIIKKTKKHYIVSWDKSKTTMTTKILATVIWLSFICTWLVSIPSPILLIMAIVYNYYETACVLAICMILAYLPWQRGGDNNNGITNIIHNIVTYYTPFYFPKLQIIICRDNNNNNNNNDNNNNDNNKEQDENEIEKIVTTEKELSTYLSSTPTFFAIHPHGAFCIGWAILFCRSWMQHVKFCFSPVLYASPLFRLFCRCTGSPASASRSSMISYIKNQYSVALPPGGFEEATLTSTTQDRVFIQKRTGFIKLCYQYGMKHIRPVYVFGENQLYWNIQGFWNWRLLLNRQGIPAILVWGNSWMPLLPKQHIPITIVIGPPLVLPTRTTTTTTTTTTTGNGSSSKAPPPTKEEIKLWHDKYIAALTRLFDEYKETAYGPEGKTMKLEVW